MNPLKSFCFVACILAGVCAFVPHQRQSSHSNSLSDSLKPTEWLSPSELESIPSVDQISLKELENMSNFEGATLINKLYHLSRINNEMKPEYKPSATDVPVYIMKPNGHNMSTTLDKLVEAAKDEPDFGDEEVTIFITGMPPKCRTITKTTDKLVRAYHKRYNGKWNDESSEESQQSKSSGGSSSSEESNQNDKSGRRKGSQELESTNKRGDLVVIDLGSTLKNFERMFMLDVDNTGSMVGKVIAQLSKEADVPQEMIHIVAQGIAAHVAGVAGRQFTRLTGHKLRRITALDPSKIFVENPNTLTALSRGDADFVDAIHTSTYGLGSPARVGDVDFYPNGPSVAVPGSDNIIEATMKATRYYAESVVPGKERNFPADAAISMNDYKNRSGKSKRAYMGIDTDFNLEGDFMLQVNPHSPYGKTSKQFKVNSLRPNNQYNSWKSTGKGFKIM